MEFLELYWNVVITGTVLAVIAFAFVSHFVKPARRIGRELDTAIARLQTIKREAGTHATDLDRIAAEVMQGATLSHCWSEFRETLHGQTGINSQGQEAVVRFRATALAETFFTDQALVETPLKTEFYKHLPGILTGIGIIGTFTGLILGLINFQVTSNADQVRQSLAGLIQNVGHAFVVSASAITLAMLATWVEKSLVTRRYRQVEELCVLIDSLFDAGAGEEYLARLVQASETSATQAIQIKDALVADLKEVLAEIAHQQNTAYAEHNRQLSESMARTFSESLKEPITRISEAVEQVSGNQGEAVNRMLTDVLANFSNQMQEMFGGQLRGMNEMLQETSKSIQGASTRFDQLADNMQSAGQGAVTQMADRMGVLVGDLDARQEIMNGRMMEFAEQIRRSVDGVQSESAEKSRALLEALGNQMSAVVTQLEQQSMQSQAGHAQQVSKLEEQLERFLKVTEMVVVRYQRETGEKMQHSLEELGGKTAGLVASLQKQSEQATRVQAERQAQFGEQTEVVLNRLAQKIEDLSSSVQRASQAMDTSVDKLSNTSRDAIERMNTGAAMLNAATDHLAQGMAGIDAATAGIADSSDRLVTASSNLLESSNTVVGVMDDYRATHDSLAGMVENLRMVVENARREASMVSDILTQLASATDKLTAAQRSADAYLDGISDVLATAHTSFAEGIEKSLRMGNTQFHLELSEAVNRLKGAIQDLGDTLDAVALKE
ncbi:MAG: anti-phage defense ZorAB system ZorA [Betaproteobacteria bacterium]|nr:anti-phage defense ZorAB system ZorA [Betaproteobacteria bacterium]